MHLGPDTLLGELALLGEAPPDEEARAGAALDLTASPRAGGPLDLTARPRAGAPV